MAAGLGLQRSGLAAVARTWNPVGGADDEEVAELIAHEVTHALMYQLMQPGDDPSWAVEEPPLWFREGWRRSPLDRDTGGRRRRICPVGGGAPKRRSAAARA